MGFYGNITNTSRTQFQFDKTFPNRKVMDEFRGTDGVYIGRFVLVEYDKTLAADWCTTAYYGKDENGTLSFYSSPQLSNTSKLLYGIGNMVEGKYIRVPGRFKDPDSEEDIIFNTVNPTELADIIFEIQRTSVGTPVVAKKISYNNNPGNDYIANYQIDMEEYKVSRGYDSTVWQKVYADGIERYVMIAELNSVVPSFSVSADAPTLSPIAPHFDADSTNIFYRVHWQPSWGLRVKAAAPNISVKPIKENGESMSGPDVIISSTTDEHLPTDEKTFWSRSAYDTKTGVLKNFYYHPSVNPDTLKTSGEWRDFSAGIITDNMKFPAAIYYNKAGFNSAVITYSDESIKDKITIEPTGLSGHKYNVHNGTGATTPQVDTQELSIMLPSIGNSIAQMWDLIYGNEEINKSKNRNSYLTWTKGSIVPEVNGLRLVTKLATGYGYEPKQVETLAGAINSVHDLMGMIIQDKATMPSSSEIKSLGKNYIYYLKDEQRYYRAHKTYTYNESITSSFNKKNRHVKIPSFTSWPADGYYYLDYADSNPRATTGGSPYPNYIREKKYDSDKTYYKTITPSRPITEFAAGSFEPYKFFEYAKEVDMNNEKGQQVKVNVYRTSMDKVFDSTHSYVKVSHEMLPENTRFWTAKEDYYTTTFKVVQNPTSQQLENYELFVLAEDGKSYTRAPMNNGIDVNQTYYTTTNFTKAEILDKNKQHFMVSKKVEGPDTYTETITYEVATGVTANNFKDKVYYIFKDNGHILAESYQSGVTYYTKNTVLTRVEGQVVITPSNIVEVYLRDINDSDYFCQYRPKSYNGYDQYIMLDRNNCQDFTSNLAILSIYTDLGIYQPNLYYYLEENENSPLYGSYIFDSNSKPTEGRTYYATDSVRHSNPLDVSASPIYESYKYYYTNTESDSNYILSTSKTPINGKTYWKRNSLYVKSDTSGIYPSGMEWNINVTTIPDSVVLSGRTEVWELQELEGFARHFNTIHGLILRMCSALESKDELIRDYETVNGVVNKMRDLLVQFGEMRANEIMVTDAYGRIISVPLTDDNTWIEATYENGSNFNIKHIGPSTSNASYQVSIGKNNDTAVNAGFGTTHRELKFTIDHDGTGHYNATSDYDYNGRLITMPNLGRNDSVLVSTPANGIVLTGLTLDTTNNMAYYINSNHAQVGTLKLNGYAMTSGETNVTQIANTDSINAAFAKINTAFNSLDLTTVGSSSDYIISVGQSNGKLSATKETKVTTLSATSTSLITSKAVYEYLANTYAGTQNITTLGTVSTGTWNASTIAVNKGGTGTNSLTSGQVLIGNGTGAVTTRAITDITNTTSSVTANTNLITANTLVNYVSKSLNGFTGTANIVTVGTIGTGVWNGTAIAANYIGNLPASKITSGTFDVARIPNLAGSKIILDGYTAQSTVTNSIASSDSVNDAIRKLEARIIALGG